MNRMVTAVINGEERSLNYSIEVMFDMAERYGNLQKALSLLAKENREGFETVRWFAVKMANDGELCHREEKYDPRPMLKEEDISLRMHPLEYSALRDAVIGAITLGYRRELENEDEEIDLGLAELNAKKDKAGT